MADLKTPGGTKRTKGEVDRLSKEAERGYDLSRATVSQSGPAAPPSRRGSPLGSATASPPRSSRQHSGRRR